MKLRLLTCVLFALAEGAMAQGRLDPVEKCSTTIGLLGRGRPISLIFPFVNWSHLHKSETTPGNMGLAEIQTKSFIADNSAGNITLCTRSSEDTARFKVYVKPILTDVPSTPVLEFEHELDITFESGPGGEKVKIEDPNNRGSDCREKMKGLMTSYFFAVNSGRSPAFVSNWTGLTNPFEESAVSYCQSFITRFDEVIRNQFYDIN